MKKLLLILFLICVIVTPVFTVSGTYTTNEYFYLPGYGSYGTDEFDEYNTYMQIADTRIEANKDGLALRYLKTEMDSFSELQAIISDKTLVNEEDVFTIDANWVNTANPWADNEVTNDPTITIADTTDSTSFPLLAETVTGAQKVKSDAGLTYDASTGDLKATKHGGIVEANLLDKSATETVSGTWTFPNVGVNKISDTASARAYYALRKKRDGDPTDNVASGDYLGCILFYGYHTDGYDLGAMIRAIVDATPGNTDMPARLEFLTSPDASATPSLRMAIDQAGNIKMGDGAWTNYVQVTVAGVMSMEGTANIEGINATELGYLNTVSSNVQDQIDGKEGTLTNEAGLYSALSDVSLFLEDLVDDTDPDLGGQMQAGAHSINFTEQVLTSGTAIAWNLGNSNKAILTAAHDFTITITAPSGALNAQVIITQDGTGTRVMDEIITQADATIATSDVHTDTEIIDITIDIPTGARIRFDNDVGTDVPEPLVEDTIYYAINVDSTHIKVATTKANAIAGTNINITDQGTNTHTVEQLVKWTSGTLGVLTTDAGAEDILALTYKTADLQWYAVLSSDFY